MKYIYINDLFCCFCFSKTNFPYIFIPFDFVVNVCQICDVKKEEFITECKINRRKIAEDSAESYKTPQVLIDQLLELYFTGKLDEKIIRDQVETIVIAGNETTALSLSYIILLLAMHTDVQDKVYDELHEVFNDQDETITYEHIQRLPYLDRVIKEGMRLLPVVPFIMRTARTDTQISNCIIPKEAFILISIYNLHRVRMSAFIFSRFQIFYEISFQFLFTSAWICGEKTLMISIRITFYQKMSMESIHLLFYLFQVECETASV